MFHQTIYLAFQTENSLPALFIIVSWCLTYSIAIISIAKSAHISMSYIILVCRICIFSVTWLAYLRHSAWLLTPHIPIIIYILKNAHRFYPYEHYIKDIITFGGLTAHYINPHNVFYFRLNCHHHHIHRQKRFFHSIHLYYKHRNISYSLRFRLQHLP